MKLLSALTLLSAGLNFASSLPLSQSNPKNVYDGIKFEKRSLKDGGQTWDYDADGPVRGVNLGGWLVLEPYMTPSLFEAFAPGDIPVDEYHYTQYLGKSLAKDRLEAHWSSFIVEDDLKAIAGLGLNFVRIPVGYWAFQLAPNDPYVQGAEQYLDLALGWAHKYGLKAWIDLHGAPGSQNGFDNSGLRDSYEFQQDSNLQLTIDILNYIFNKYGGKDYEDVVIGIEILNEPLGPVLDMNKLMEFYSTAYKNLRDTGSVQNVVLHDAFQDYTYFNDKFTLDQSYWNVVIDHHHYQVFSTAELVKSIDEKVQVACQWGRDSVDDGHWNVCGEFSAALTDCAKWLNGVGRGARYDQSFTSSPSDNYEYLGSCENSQVFSSWSQDQKNNYRRYIEAQLDAFEQRGGWVFWSWKTENTLEWDLQQLTYNNVFPVPITSRQYPNQCGFN